jgi:rhodanese-related sulfurtransferase
MKRIILTAVSVFLIVFIAAPSAIAQGAGEKVEDRADSPDYSEEEVLTDLIENGDTEYTLVDVRTPEEYADGYIPTAVNIPLSEIGDNPPTDERDALIVLYCRSGNRSGQAEKILEGLGYTNVHNFGGIIDWSGKTVTP